MRRFHAVALLALAFSIGGCVCTPVNRERDDGGLSIDGTTQFDAGDEIDARVATPIPADCFEAATRGIAWLVTQQQADGAYGIERRGAATAFAVLKLETYAAELGLSPFDQAFVYHNQVVAGLDWLFLQTTQPSLALQPYGNPDGNGNGVGLTVGADIYEHSMAVIAIVAGGEPQRLVNVPGSAVDGLTYRTVVEDAIDYLAMAQSDAAGTSPPDCTRGGWRYNELDGVAGLGDNSVTQWVTLAFEYAHHPLYHYEIPIPDWVVSELREWVTCIQHDGAGPDHGGSGYLNGSESANAYRTGALIQQQAFLGDTLDTPRVQAALAYLERVWTIREFGWKTIPVSRYLAMYSIMKGMESMAITDLGTIDWYREFCDQLKLEQLADGSWPVSAWETERVGDSGLLSTLWALLVLERAAPPPEVIP